MAALSLNTQAERRSAQNAFSSAATHPVEAIQKDWLRNQLENKHYVMGNVYGSHLPMRIKMEMSIVSQVQRPPGLPSHHVALDTILNRDETIEFEDYLGVPELNEQEVDARALLERKHGLQPPTSILGPPANLHRVAGGGPLPRAGVAMPKDLC